MFWIGLSESIGHFVILVLVSVFGHRYLTWGTRLRLQPRTLKLTAKEPQKWPPGNWTISSKKLWNFGLPTSPPPGKNEVFGTLEWSDRLKRVDPILGNHPCASSMRQDIRFRVPWHPWHRIGLGRRHFRHCLRATPETAEALGSVGRSIMFMFTYELISYYPKMLALFFEMFTSTCNIVKLWPCDWYFSGLKAPARRGYGHGIQDFTRTWANLCCSLDSDASIFRIHTMMTYARSPLIQRLIRSNLCQTRIKASKPSWWSSQL